MTKLTDKQTKWLQKVQNKDIGQMLAYVAEFDGLLYAATIDGFRLHAIKVENLEPGQYDLFDNELQPVNKTKTYYEAWPKIIPTQYEVKQIIVPEKLGDLKVRANEYNAICVNEQLGIWLNYRFYYDATHYNGECEMRILDAKHGICFNYADGSLAVVQPLNVEK